MDMTGFWTTPRRRGCVRSLGILAAPLLLAAGSGSGSEALPSLVIAAEPATIELAPQAGERHLMRLPGLEFPARITPACPADTRIHSVSVTIADSTHVYRGADFGSGTFIDAVLSVPARQVAPLTVAGLCVAGSDNPAHRVLVPAVLTAHASLRCAADTGDTVHYATLGLGVEFVCAVVE